MAIRNIQATMVQNLQENSGGITILDVREADEFAEIAAPFAKNFPLSNLDIETVLNSLNLSLDNEDTPLYLICRSGGRATKAAEKFHAAGYKNVYNIEGGMIRWQELGLPTRK